MSYELERLFKQLDLELSENVDHQYFQEPREFRSLIEVLGVLNEQVDQMNRHKETATDLSSVLKEDAKSHVKLDQQLQLVNKVIEEVVAFQHGGLNNSLDTMSEVVKEYNRSKDEIKTLRKSLVETQTVLTAKKSGQVSLKELWAKKVELKETLRMVRELEELKNLPLRINRLFQQKKYLTSVILLNDAISKVFSEDLVNVGGLLHIREQLLGLKEKLLECCIDELKDTITNIPVESGFDDTVSVVSDNDIASELNGSSYSHNHEYLHDDHTSGRRSASAFQESFTYNLADIDESLENSLPDPSTNSLLFIKILVQSIGYLHCEEDVEHLLEEAVIVGFAQGVISRIKSQFQSKLSRINQADSALNPDDELKVHGKLFEEFTSVLLDSLLLVFQRIVYVYKLLEVSKARRENKTDEISKESLHKLLAIILPQLKLLEEQIQQEISVHLVEADVQNISDTMNAGPKPRSLTEDDDYTTKTDRPIFRSSIWHASGIYSKIFKYSNKLFKLIESSFGEGNYHDANRGSSKELSLVTSSLLTFIQRRIEEELIPVVQSWVNQESRELQSTESKSSAEDLLSNSSTVLFKLWLQLFSHREFVSVVYDRLLKTVISVFRENEEYLFSSINMITYLAKIDFQPFLRKDANFQLYKTRLTQSYQNLPEILAKFQLSISSYSSFYVSSESPDLHSQYIEEFMTLQSAFRELQGLPLPKFVPESSCISSIAALTSDCDKLSQKLLRSVIGTLKSSNATNSMILMNDVGEFSKVANLKNLKQSLSDSKKFLMNTTMSNLDQFVLIEEESIAIIRKTLQVLSFYQINGLVSSFYEFIHSSRETFSEEGTVSVFLRPITGLIEVLANRLPPILLICALGPISTTLPRIFLRGIISPFLSSPLSLSANRIAILKSGILKIVVSMQQQLIIILQSVMEKELECRKKVIDICCEEFERVRRFISMIDTPRTEVDAFSQLHGAEFLEDEIATLKFLCMK